MTIRENTAATAVAHGRVADVTAMQVGSASYGTVALGWCGNCLDAAGSCGCARRFHREQVHPVPQAGCPNCPASTPCICGQMACPDVSAHAFAYAASETTWRAVAAR